MNISQNIQSTSYHVKRAGPHALRRSGGRQRRLRGRRERHLLWHTRTWQCYALLQLQRGVASSCEVQILSDVSSVDGMSLGQAEVGYKWLILVGRLQGRCARDVGATPWIHGDGELWERRFCAHFLCVWDA